MSQEKYDKAIYHLTGKDKTERDKVRQQWWRVREDRRRREEDKKRRRGSGSGGESLQGWSSE